MMHGRVKEESLNPQELPPVDGNDDDKSDQKSGSGC